MVDTKQKTSFPKLRRSWILVSLLIFTLFLVSCGSGIASSTSSNNAPTPTISTPTVAQPTQPVSQPGSSLVGAWSGGPCTAQYFTLYEDPLRQIEFTPNGTFIWNNGTAGQYSLLDSQRLELTISGVSEVYRFSILGSTLTLLNSSGDSCILNRTS